MEFSTFVVAAACMGVTWGYQPLEENVAGHDSGGGMEYVLQISPDELASLAAGEVPEIVSLIPAEARPITRVRIVIGPGDVPRNSPSATTRQPRSAASSLRSVEQSAPERPAPLRANPERSVIRGQSPAGNGQERSIMLPGGDPDPWQMRNANPRPPAISRQPSAWLSPPVPNPTTVPSPVVPRPATNRGPFNSNQPAITDGNLVRRTADHPSPYPAAAPPQLVLSPSVSAAAVPYRDTPLNPAPSAMDVFPRNSVLSPPVFPTPGLNQLAVPEYQPRTTATPPVPHLNWPRGVTQFQTPVVDVSRGALQPGINGPDFPPTNPGIAPQRSQPATPLWKWVPFAANPATISRVLVARSLYPQVPGGLAGGLNVPQPQLPAAGSSPTSSPFVVSNSDSSPANVTPNQPKVPEIRASSNVESPSDRGARTADSEGTSLLNLVFCFACLIGSVVGNFWQATRNVSLRKRYLALVRRSGGLV